MLTENYEEQWNLLKKRLKKQEVSLDFLPNFLTLENTF